MNNDGGNLKIPDWVKFAVAVIGGTLISVGWVELRFVSRVEYVGHSVQNALDMERLASTQKAYAVAEATTASNMTALKVDVSEIKTDVGWLRSYLDVSKPPPRKNGNGK